MVDDGQPKKKKEVAFSHLGREKIHDYDESASLGLSDRIALGITNVKQKSQDAHHEHVDDYKRFSQGITSNKWRIILVVSSFIVILILAVVVPSIPLLMNKNAAYSAMEDGDYALAFDKFKTYLAEKPDDFQANVAASKMAIMAGEYNYAENLIAKIYSPNNLKDDPTVRFLYVLTKLNEPKLAIAELDKVLESIPNHIASRVLRGYLSREDPALQRQSREDFVKAEKALYAQQDSSIELQIMHRFFIAQKKIIINLGTVDTPYLFSEKFPLESLIGFDPTQTILKLDFQMSNNEGITDNLEQFTDQSIIALYYFIALIEQKELKGAESYISEIKSLVGDDVLAIRQLEGFLAVAQEEWGTAVKIFQHIDDNQTSPDRQTKSNIATAMFYSSEFALPEVIAVYDQILELEQKDNLAVNNALYLNILNKDTKKANQIIDTHNTLSNDRFKLLVGIVRLLEGNYPEAGVNFSSISTSNYKEAPFFTGAVLVQQGQYEKALAHYWDLYDSSSDERLNKITLLLRIQLMNHLRDWAAAYYLLRNSQPTDFTDDLVYYYLRGLASIKIDNLIDAEDQINVLKEKEADAPHYLHALQAAYSVAMGNDDNAVMSYLLAIEAAPSIILKQEYVLDVAIVMQRQGKTDEAVALLRSHGDNSTLYNPRLAALLAYFIVNDSPNRALDLVDNASKVNQSYFVHRYAGHVYLQLNDIPKAISFLEKARDWYLIDLDLLDDIRSAYQTNNEVDKVEDTVRTISAVDTYLQNKTGIEFDNTNSELILHVPRLKDIKKSKALVDGITEVTIDENKDKQTIQKVYDIYDTLINEASPKKSEILYSKATFDLLVEDYTQALASFDSALAIGLPSEELQLVVMRLYVQQLLQQSHYKKSLTVLEQIKEIDGDLSFNYILSATALEGLGDTTAAISLLTDYITQEPHNITAYRNLIELYISVGELLSAERLTQKALRVFPKEVTLQGLLADVFTYNENKSRKRFRKRVFIDLVSRAN